MRPLVPFILIFTCFLSPVQGNPSLETLLKLPAGGLWRNFLEISRFPRPSKGEGKIREHIQTLAKRLEFRSSVDAAGNLLVWVPATPGREALPTVVLQCHLDMVQVKEPGSGHRFDQDPLLPVVDADWVRATGTTLGADNGIGVAALLAVMTDHTLSHGPLELLFTVDEEGDFSGICKLAPDALQGRLLINVDSEEWHEFNIGCAGGQADTMHLPLAWESPPEDLIWEKIVLQGLKGGHSGVDIHRERANALKLLGRLLEDLTRTFPSDLFISELSGGTTDTAIPDRAVFTVGIRRERQGDVHHALQRMQSGFQASYRTSDPELAIVVEPWGEPPPARSIGIGSIHRLEAFLQTLPNGVQKMSQEWPEYPETSLNIGVLHTATDSLRLVCHIQSSDMTAIASVSTQVAAITRTLQGAHQAGEPYPAWPPRQNSPLRDLAMRVHQDLFGSPPKIKVVHAGLECGELAGKYPDMDMLSFGPAIENAHTPAERVNIASVDDFWLLLRQLIQRLSESP